MSWRFNELFRGSAMRAFIECDVITIFCGDIVIRVINFFSFRSYSYHRGTEPLIVSTFRAIGRLRIMNNILLILGYVVSFVECTNR